MNYQDETLNNLFVDKNAIFLNAHDLGISVTMTCMKYNVGGKFVFLDENFYLVKLINLNRIADGHLIEYEEGIEHFIANALIDKKYNGFIPITNRIKETLSYDFKLPLIFKGEDIQIGESAEVYNLQKLIK